MLEEMTSKARTELMSGGLEIFKFCSGAGLVPLAGLARVLCCFFVSFRLRNKRKGRSAHIPSRRARVGADLK